MKRAETIAHLEECVRLSESREPMTADEVAAHLSRCADEQARAEARRSATTQPDLLGAA